MTKWEMIEIKEVAPSEPCRDHISDEQDVWHLSLDQIENDSQGIVNKVYGPANQAGVSTAPFGPGNVLYSKLRPYLNKVICPNEVGYATTELIPLRPDPNRLDRYFLCHFLRSPDFVRWASIHVVGVNLPRVQMQEFWKYRIPLPPLSEQRRLASILDEADAIRKARRESLRLLDELVKSTFLDMFGDPVSNPMGWEKKFWQDVFNTTTGKLDANAAVDNGQYPFFTCAKEVFQIDKYAFDCEALLLAGNNATANYDVKHYKGKFNAYQRTYVITLIDGANEYQLFRYQLESKLTQMQNQSLGTNTRYLTMGILKRLDFLVPDIKHQKSFAVFVAEVDRQREAANTALAESEQLFASLSQRAFRGEL